MMLINECPTIECDWVVQRRRRAVATVATAGIVGVVLVGAAAGYWIVNMGGASGASDATQQQTTPTQQEAPR